MSINTRRIIRFAVLAAFALAMSGPFFSQGTGTEANLVKDLKWRNIGPANMTGRISAFDALDKDFTQVLIGGASGGVWRSVNAGTTWEPIFEKYGTSSIGDVAFFQKDPNIIWVGTGEECVRNSVEWGDGVYKSVDGGKTFARMGLENTQTIAKVLPHPTDANTCYVSAAGHPWGYTGDRGLFKTTDGGKTWMKLAGGLPNDGKAGAMDLVMDSGNPDTLYVTFWQRLRQPWRFDSGGPGGGIFKSTDAGKTWARLTKGLPAGNLGRIGIAVARTNPKVLAAIVEATFQPARQMSTPEGMKENPDFKDMTKLGSGIYRSEDGGETWTFMNRTNSRPFYYSHIFINPLDDKLVYYMSESIQFSEDGGRTLKQIPGLHPDFHAMWIDPTNKNRFYVGQDGGAALTHDHGKTWIYYDNLAFSQFYAVSADMRDPYFVYGGLQDNGTWGGPSMHREGAILTDFWFNVGGGDGFHTQNDPSDWKTVYGESQGGSVQRVNAETREARSIRPSQMNIINYKDVFPNAPAPAAGGQGAGQRGQGGGQRAGQAAQPPAAGAGAGGQRGQGMGQAAGQGGAAGAAGGQFGGGQRGGGPFRFNWSAPIRLSAHNPKTVFFAGNYVFKSVDRGDHWMIISPDLTTNNPDKNKPSGGLTNENTGAETHCTIITVAESPIRPGLIWAGTDDGNVQVTRNDGGAWTNVRPNITGVPANTWVSRVEASHFDEGTAYVSFDGHRSDDFKPYVFKTTDFGKTWTAITSGLPDGGPVYCVIEDLKNKNLLFAGTQFAVYFSINGGKAWTSLSLNAPTMAFHDLIIHPRDNDLIAATHSRGIWILDDISALQQASDTVLGGDAFLFAANRPATRWLRIGRGGYSRGNLFFKGENPPTGALIHYYLKDKPAGPVMIEISDVTGAQKATFTIDNPKLGINRLVWDFRFDPAASMVPGAISAMKAQINTIAGRGELNDEQRAAVQDAIKQLEAVGTNYRRAQEIQQGVMQTLGGGGGFGGGGGGGQRGGMGANVAEPGVYAVKMTVGGKTMTGKVMVRQDPMLDGN